MRASIGIIQLLSLAAGASAATVEEWGAGFDEPALGGAGVSQDPTEAHTLRQNIARATSFEVDAEGGVGDAIEAALIMVSAGAEAMVDDANWLVGDPSSASLERFQRQREEWQDDRGWCYEEALPQAMIDPPAEPFAMVQIDADRHDLLYLRDTLRHHDEDLYRLWKNESSLPMFKNLGWSCQRKKTRASCPRK